MLASRSLVPLFTIFAIIFLLSRFTRLTEPCFTGIY